MGFSGLGFRALGVLGALELLLGGPPRRGHEVASPVHVNSLPGADAMGVRKPSMLQPGLGLRGLGFRGLGFRGLGFLLRT